MKNSSSTKFIGTLPKVLALGIMLVLAFVVATWRKGGSSDPGSTTDSAGGDPATSPSGLAPTRQGASGSSSPSGDPSSHPYRTQVENIAEKLTRMHDSSPASFAALFALTDSDTYLAELENRLDESPEFGVQLAIMLNTRVGNLDEFSDVLARSLKFFPDSPELKFLQAAVLGRQKMWKHLGRRC